MGIVFTKHSLPPVLLVTPFKAPSLALTTFVQSTGFEKGPKALSEATYKESQTEELGSGHPAARGMTAINMGGDQMSSPKMALSLGKDLRRIS